MCGIAGRSARGPIEAGHAGVLAGQLEEQLRQRGPDGLGMHHDSELLLVHRRLAIVDLTPAAAQPLWNEDRSVCVIVNGEIYGYKATQDRLRSSGHRFRSRSDSEVLVHLYEDLGIDECCRSVHGMFAFALWDARTRDLYLVRDRLGIKPLVISEHEHGLTFASTLSALQADPAVPRALNDEALLAYLRWGFVPSPWSAIASARHVMPGTLLRVRAGRLVEERRWWLDAPADTETTVQETQAAIESAVRSHLVADVPVGALLSAGIDSGIVTALAARESPASPIAAWTVSHRGEREDEFDDAAKIARHIGVEHNEVSLGAAGMSEKLFEEVVSDMDEPLATSSLVGLHRLFRRISPARRVVLSGDGGDELFGGYDWHVGMPAAPVWARGAVFGAVAPVLAPFGRGPGWVGTLGTIAAFARRHPASVYLDKLRLTTEKELERIGVPSVKDDPIEESALEAWERFAGCGVLEQMLAVDRATALVDEMLAKVDAASMSFSVEARVPLLADEVVAAAKGLSASKKRNGATGKLVLREWFRLLGPPGLADRPKTGFNSPVSSWLAGSAGESLRALAAESFAMVGASGQPVSPKLIYAASVLALRVRRLRDTPRRTTSYPIQTTCAT